MILSAAVVIYALSLLSCSHALSINVRRDDCPLVCPETDADKNGLSKFSIDDATISCSYVGKPDNSCTYDMTNGTIISDCDGCIKEAVRQCSPHRSRELKQAVARRGAKDGIPDGRGPRPSPSATWKHHDGPSSRPNRASPSPTWEKGSRPKQATPSPTWEKGSHPKRAAPSPTWEKDSYPPSYSEPSPSPTWEKDSHSSSYSKPSPSPTWEKDSHSSSYSKPSPSPTWEKDSHSSSYTKPSPSPTWEKGSHPKRVAPSPTWEKDSHPPSYSKSSPSPSPSPTWKSETQPPKQEECNYMCPQEDLAKTQLTDETIQDTSLLCSYSSPDCKCKYSKKTGLLLEDNDEGKCPQTATPAQHWDRRYI